ncbi:MAG TPA: acyl-CoA synthetase [Alphaproteobacteria bacterium]|nr:acyl-CoA synthetase [Alphaproteobacteria bacterium]
MSGMLISGARSLSCEALGERVARAARVLAEHGVGRGDVVAFCLRNDFPLFEGAYATAMLGAYAVPMNWHFKAAEAAHVLRDSGAKALVIHADLLPPLAGSVPPGVAVLQVATPPEIAGAYAVPKDAVDVPPGAADWTALVGAATPLRPPGRPLPISIIYTSGTTGVPKGVRRHTPTPEQLAAARRIFATTYGFDGPVRAIATGPLYHSAPYSYATRCIHFGGTLVLQPRFDAEELLQLIERYRITHFHIVPIMFVRLLKLPEAVRRRYDLSSLEFVIHGAAPCPPEVKRAMIDWWGPVIHEYYGSTETSLVTHCSSEEWLARPGTTGKPMEGIEVKILDSQGRPLPPGECGEIYVRSPRISDFTYHNHDDARRAIDRDGFVTLGDIGYLDEDGYLFLNDRSRDMIISGGVNIYPAEIEAALHTLPGVHDCAVFGIPDAEFGERIAAVIELRPGVRLTADAVLAHLQPRLANYKLPSRIEFRSDLPREDSGKIFKRKLREPYWTAAGRRI